MKPRTAQWRGAEVKSLYPGPITFMVTSCREDAGNESQKNGATIEVKTIILGRYNTFKFNFKRLQRSVQKITNMPNEQIRAFL